MKKTLIVLIPLVVIILLVGGFVYAKNSLFGTGEPTPTPTAPVVSGTFGVPDKKETEAEVSLTSRLDKKGIIVKIDKIPSDVQAIDYEIDYVNTKGLPRGLIGKINSPEGSVSKNLDLGTCSRGVCVFDEGVTKVILNLKFTRSSGDTGFSQEYSLD